MNELKKKMIRKAKQQYDQIYPCSAKKTLRDCFTVEEDQILFWFNTTDESTHVLSQDLA
jgi:hypothetical protein